MCCVVPEERAVVLLTSSDVSRLSTCDTSVSHNISVVEIVCRWETQEEKACFSRPPFTKQIYSVYTYQLFAR